MTMHDVSKLTCREVVEHVSELLGDGLAGDERITLEQHLLVCPPCTLHVEQMRSTIAVTAALRAPAPPPASVLDAFRRWKEAR